jgi:hypothetical protein
MKKDISQYFDVIGSIETVQEASCFASDIDTFVSCFKSGNGNLEQALGSINPDSAKKISQALAKSDPDTNNQDVTIDFLSTLKGSLKELKIIKLILAFDPSCKTIANIHNFVKSTLGNGYILDIEVSEDVVGGAIIIFNGKYCDLSLKKNIEETFKTRREEITTVVG